MKLRYKHESDKLFATYLITITLVILLALILCPYITPKYHQYHLSNTFIVAGVLMVIGGRKFIWLVSYCRKVYETMRFINKWKIK